MTSRNDRRSAVSLNVATQSCADKEFTSYEHNLESLYSGLPQQF